MIIILVYENTKNPATLDSTHDPKCFAAYLRLGCLSEPVGLALP